LIGTGGTGKTRLAHAVAEEVKTEFPHGVLFIDLASVTQAELVPSTIARSLDIEESGSESLIKLLKNVLHEKRILLILDNFEQLLSAASFVKELTETALSLKILITSRATLQLSIEHELIVKPLSSPPIDSKLSIDNLAEYPAIKLFLIRARAVKSNFVFNTDNAPIISEICYKLDGLPLAIELAAARIKLLSPISILTRLKNSLKLLTGGSKHLPPRQQTMRGTIEWSYQLLDEDEKTLFRRLAVFAGGFTVETAEAVCESYELQSINDGLSKVQSETQKPKFKIEVLDVITSLIDNNLLSQMDQPDGNARLGMLGVVREFAFECLEASGDSEPLRQNHSLFFLSLAEEAERHLLGDKSVEWLERLETEHDNLRAALYWSLEKDTETACRIIAALRYFWANHNYLTEAYSWLKAALERSEDVSSMTYFKLLNGLGQFARYTGDFETARKAYEKVLIAETAANALAQIAISNHGLAAVATKEGDFATAQKFNEEELAIYRQLNDESGIAYALASLGDLALAKDDIQEARPLIEESLNISRNLGNKQVVSINLVNLGMVAYSEQNYKEAYSYFAESIRLAQELGNKAVISCSLDGFASIAEKCGNATQSVMLAGASEQMRESIGYNKEPAEQLFCETYIVKTRAALNEKAFADAFEQGRIMNMSEVLELTKISNFQFVHEAALQSAEIVIESHTFSRILIEENIIEEENENEFQDEK
jgi:predicted ATPase